MTYDPDTYLPPFPWFGGKSTVAPIVWDALGADVPNYVEPFYGSGAVLMLRPGGAGHTETVNDADGFVANFWRAMKGDPDSVAEHADNPANECDLHARHLWLLGQRERITDRLCGDPDWFDAKVAGWWCWGQCCWIGSGWCSGKGPWVSRDGVMVLRGEEEGRGAKRKLPHLGTAGQGVCASNRREYLVEYCRSLAERLSNVRVCCGDWSRVCGPSVTIKHGITGVFLDPPYSETAGRADDLYAVDCTSVAHAVREWAIEEGRNPLMRIVLAGYDGEHVMPNDWRVIEWKAKGGYSNQADDESAGKVNCHRERLWLSPHCLNPESADVGLFAGGAA